MKTYLTTFALCILSSLSIAQNVDTKGETDSVLSRFESFNLKYETGRIVLKDKSVIKKAKLYKIHPYWIVYEKHGSLHDLYIEEIQWIEIDKEKQSMIIFDENNKPVYSRRDAGGANEQKVKSKKQ